MNKETNSNAELDFASTEFNALDALTNDVEIPVPEAPVYDNLGQFISTVRNRGRSRARNDEAGPSRRETFSTSTRRFLPHQEPVMGRGRGRIQRNVLTRMEEVTRGPMSVLRNCMLNKTRVKVMWSTSALVLKPSPRQKNPKKTSSNLLARKDSQRLNVTTCVIRPGRKTQQRDPITSE